METYNGFIPIDQILAALTNQDVIDIVGALGGTDYIEHENEIIFKTICHHKNEDEGSHKLYYYKNSKLFVCYTHCGTFNLIELIRKRYELLDIEYDFYNDIVLRLANKVKILPNTYHSSFYNPYESDFEKFKVNKPKVEMKAYDPAILNSFIFYPTDEWLKEGISTQAMHLYTIRYSIEENKIIIPHYDYQGRLVGIRGRALNEEDLIFGKYAPISKMGKIYRHPLGFNLYGLNMVAGNIRRLRTALIFEGEKGPLLYSTLFGQENNIAVATCGSTLHDYQIDLLIQAGAEQVVICYDKEGGSWQEQEQYFRKLQNLCCKYRHKIQMGFIWDTKNLLQLKDSPIDRGKETFLKLYWSAVWV